MRFSLETRLARDQAINILPLQSYFTFMDLLTGADFVVSDGGSIQEECYFLNVPCLIMRAKTERREGLGINSMLAQFDQDRVDEFLRTFSSLVRKDTDDDQYPSRAIVDEVLSWAQ